MTSLNVLLLIVCSLCLLSIVALALLVLRAGRRATALVAKVSHELAMDAAVNVRGLKDPSDAMRLVRSSVDPELSDALARHLGPGYERYLLALHARALGR